MIKCELWKTAYTGKTIPLKLSESQGSPIYQRVWSIIQIHRSNGLVLTHAAGTIIEKDLVAG